MDTRCQYWSFHSLSPHTDKSVLSAQVVLINAVKDVAKALGDLIRATKAAAGKPHDDPAMLQLKNSAKVGICGKDFPDFSDFPFPIILIIITTEFLDKGS